METAGETLRSNSGDTDHLCFKWLFDDKGGGPRSQPTLNHWFYPRIHRDDEHLVNPLAHTSVKLTGPSDREIVHAFFSFVESTTKVGCENASEIPSGTIVQINIVRNIAGRTLPKQWVKCVRGGLDCCIGFKTFGTFLGVRGKVILSNLDVTVRYIRTGTVSGSGIVNQHVIRSFAIFQSARQPARDRHEGQLLKKKLSTLPNAVSRGSERPRERDRKERRFHLRRR